MARGLLGIGSARDDKPPTKESETSENNGPNGYIDDASFAKGQDTNGNSLQPGVAYTYNGQGGYTWVNQEGGKLFDTSNTQILGKGSPKDPTTPTPNPTTPEQQPFNLPWYPLTWGLGNGTFQNLREQIWDSNLPRDHNEATYGRFDFGQPNSQQQPYTPNTGHYNPFPVGQPRGGPPPEIPRGPSPGRDGTRGGLLASSVSPANAGVAGLLGGDKMASKSLLGGAANTMPQQAAAQQTPMQGGISGDWTNFTFQNPTEGWMQNWNALDPSLRPYYAYAKVANEGGKGSTTTQGRTAIWSALENLGGYNAQDLAGQRTQAVNAMNMDPGWIVQNGSLMHNGQSMASLANPSSMPMTAMSSPAYMQWLQAAQGRDTALAASGGNPNAARY